MQAYDPVPMFPQSCGSQLYGPSADAFGEVWAAVSLPLWPLHLTSSQQ